MNDQKRPILVIEDSAEDFEITESSLRLAGVEHPLIRCKTGDEALNFLHQRAPYTMAPEPLFILIDLNLPGTDGRQLLAELRQSHWLSAVPAIVLSTSTNPRDVRLCYELGASGYLVKPVDLDRFERMIQGLTEYWLSIVILPDKEELGYAGKAV